MQELKSHDWFHDFNWELLKRKQIKAPYIPIIEPDQPIEPREPDEAEVNARKQLNRVSF